MAQSVVTNTSMRLNRTEAVQTDVGANRHAFPQPDFNAYPKLGVWPDAYYMSFNMFTTANVALDPPPRFAVAVATFQKDSLSARQVNCGAIVSQMNE